MEYGVIAPGHPDLDPGSLAHAVVAAVAVPATPCFADSATRMLGNGGRCYVDHGHPEYCTPETTNAVDAVVWELAGDRIVAAAAEAASAELGVGVRVFRNNTDGHGHSYGYHENVLLSRCVPWERVERHLPTFLVTRAVYAGAGRLGLGCASEVPGFQLSQRADFFERVLGLNTMANRGIVNTRDEPHADPGLWRRLHVIAGDANRNPWASWLRLGALGLFVEMLEADAAPQVLLADPVAAFRTVSRDLTLRAPLELAGGGSATALEIQREFAAAALPSDPAASAVVAAWLGILDDLESDPASTGDRLDWPARWELVRAYQRRLDCSLGDPRLAALDLAWADLSPGSPWDRLRSAGRFSPWPVPGSGTLDVRIASAMSSPPTDTRAFARGRMIASHPDRVVAADWASVLLRGDDGYVTFAMPDPRGWGEADYAPVAGAPWLARG